MPITPLHYPLAYLLYKLNEKLSLPGLIVGSMLPDIEVPAIILLLGTQVPDRLVLHSLLGAATLGTGLSVTFTVLMYPPLISFFLKIDKRKVEKKCRLYFALVFSCFLGNLSHVLLDVATHTYNPLFWPFSQFTPSLISLTLEVHIILLVLLAALFIKQHRNLEKLLVGE